ncbi:hypothetical protein [Halorubrum halophilum]|uniref:hypothetical protein n=1 Tax=Halorubrum halophilum TaxID=413816 RepID=UPI00186B2745|nr:hypothetical protein [Halorubrum halophilum]
MPSTDTTRVAPDHRWETTLHGIRRLPHRTAAFIVMMHPAVWVGLFVALPLAILGSMAVFGSQAAVGYVIVCAWLC